MSSSGSRGPPRYNDRSEYTDYGKSRRKNFYSINPNGPSSNGSVSGNTPGGSSTNLSRRDYKAGIIPKKDPSRSYSSSTARSYSAGLKSFGSYHSNYNNYQGKGLDFYSNWRKESRKDGLREYSSESKYMDKYQTEAKYDKFGESKYDKLGESKYDKFLSEPKHESKFDSRHNDYKFDSKYDSKFDSNYDSKFDSKYDSKFDSKYDSKYDSKLDSKFDSKLDKFDSKTNSEHSFKNGAYTASYKSTPAYGTQYNANKVPMTSNRLVLSRYPSKDRGDRRPYTSGLLALVNSTSPKRIFSGDLYYSRDRHKRYDYRNRNYSAGGWYLKLERNDDENDQDNESDSDDDNDDNDDPQTRASARDTAELLVSHAPKSDPITQPKSGVQLDLKVHTEDVLMATDEIEEGDKDDRRLSETKEDEREEEKEAGNEFDEEHREAALNVAAGKETTEKEVSPQYTLENKAISEAAISDDTQKEESASSVGVIGNDLKTEGVSEISVESATGAEPSAPFPMNEMDAKFAALQEEFLAKTHHASCERILLDFTLLPSYRRNLQMYGNKRDALMARMKKEKASLLSKKVRLCDEYLELSKIYRTKSLKMDQQLRLLHPVDDEMRREIDAGNLKSTQPHVQLPGLHDSLPHGGSPDQSFDDHASGRRGRRHGDLVTTEAEFQEILALLGEDPLSKAERLAAPIPDLVLDPHERESLYFMDVNNAVYDKEKWAQRVKTDFVDDFSALEHALFCEGFCLAPKRFGAISRHMGGLRTASDCVIHYYVTKKRVNYKQLLLQHKKKASRKSSKRKSTSNRSRNALQVNTPTQQSPTQELSLKEAFGVENKDEDHDEVKGETDTVGYSIMPTEEELYTDSGRRKRAAAPQFQPSDVPKKKKREEMEKNDAPDVEMTNVEEKEKKELKKERKEKDKEHKKEQKEKDKELKKEQKEREREQKKEQKEKQKERDADGKPKEFKNKDLAELSGEHGGPKKGDSDSPAEPNGITFDYEIKERRKAISSYWSITEANLFPELLLEFGTNWAAIADKLSTKTATMVRNYYQRNSQKHGWDSLAGSADGVESTHQSLALSLVPIGTFQHVSGVKVEREWGKEETSEPTRGLVSGISGGETSGPTSVPEKSGLESNVSDYSGIAPKLPGIAPKLPGIGQKYPGIAPKLPGVENTVKVSAELGPVEATPQKPDQHAPRSSIMSLLNADSPVKQNEQSLQINGHWPKEQPAEPLQKYNKDGARRVHDLLN